MIPRFLPRVLPDGVRRDFASADPSPKERRFAKARDGFVKVEFTSAGVRS